MSRLFLIATVCGHAKESAIGAPKNEIKFYSKIKKRILEFYFKYLTGGGSVLQYTQFILSMEFYSKYL